MTDEAPLRLLTVKEAAGLLKRSEGAMRFLRHAKKGPKSALVGGRVMYREQDVIAWANAAFDSESTA